MIIKKLDIHAHVVLEKEYPCMGHGMEMGLTCGELRGMYDRIGVERGVALPLVSPEHMSDQFTVRDARLAAGKFPETIGWWFCNIDPRWLTNSPEADLSIPMTYYKSLGAKGIGELTANLPVDDPMMHNLFRHAEKCGLPILFHVGQQGDDYGIVDGLGLHRIEEALQRFPKLRLIVGKPRGKSEGTRRPRRPRDRAHAQLSQYVCRPFGRVRRERGHARSGVRLPVPGGVSG